MDTDEEKKSMTTRLGLHTESQRPRKHKRKIRRHGACILIFQHQPNGDLKGENRDNIGEKIINSEKKTSNNIVDDTDGQCQA